MKIKLKVDSRNSHAHMRVGQTTKFMDEMNFDDPNIKEPIQSPGNVECGAYSCTYAAQNLTKVEYDIDDLFNRVSSNKDGVNPNEIFSEVIRNGFLRKGKEPIQENRIKVFNSYHDATTGNFDAMNNARSAMTIDNSPLIIFSNWYTEWLNLPDGAEMPIGKTRISGHMYAGLGWFTKDKYGNVFFMIEWWGGKTYRMSREVFNDTVSHLGCGAVTFSTLERDIARRKTLTEATHDWIINRIIWLYQQLLEIKKKAP